METATFTASATNGDGDSLTYSINFGDGSSATGQSVTHAYTAKGNYTVTLTVDNADRSTSESVRQRSEVGSQWSERALRGSFFLTELAEYAERKPPA